MVAVKVIVLVLFGLFTTPDQTIVPNTLVITGTSSSAFKSKDECEAAWVDIESKAKKSPDAVHALGHSCDEIELEAIGQDI